MDALSILQKEIDERKSEFLGAVDGLQAAKRKAKTTAEKINEINNVLEKTDLEIIQAGEDLQKITRAWSAGEASQSDTNKAQKAINQLEQKRLDSSRILETLKAQAGGQKAIIDDLTRQTERAEKTLWQLAERAEIEKINQEAARMIKKAFLARQKWKGAWGFPKSMGEYVQHVFKDLALHEKEKPAIEKELAAFFE